MIMFHFLAFGQDVRRLGYTSIAPSVSLKRIKKPLAVAGLLTRRLEKETQSTLPGEVSPLRTY